MQKNDEYLNKDKVEKNIWLKRMDKIVKMLLTYPYKEKIRQIYMRLKKIKLKKTTIRFIKKISKWISSSWKIILTTVPSFLFFYYLIGSTFVENMDVSTGYAIPTEKTSKFETTNSMAFIIKREVDGKMWTPNLPIIFPAYALDNMPNFQVGIIEAVRDISSSMRKFIGISEQQKKDIEEAYTLLRYSPYVWLLSKKSAFSIAPSSNSQYRKAAKELRKFNQDGVYVPTISDLDRILQKISKGLLELTHKNEEHQQENSSNWVDFKADNLFYHNRGYAFAMWQISKALAFDFKEIILSSEAYTEWTYLISSLKKASEYKTIVIRNGDPNGIFSPNHLIIQNYYLSRALSSAEKIRNLLSKDENAN